jgi:lipoprotein-anchoring transpeptidase ErfK/SrfK
VIRRRTHRAPRYFLACAAVAVAALSSGCNSAGTVAATGPISGTGSTSATQENGTSRVGDLAPRGSSLVATARTPHVIVATAPGHGSTRTMDNPNAIGAPLTFLVLESRSDWLRVLLPTRPNGSTGWISRAGVQITVTPYRLVISMSKHRLDVVYRGRRVARYPVGVGTVATPTPKGTYYLTELIQPPDPTGAYGPYAFGLSAFSNTLKTFAGGPGQLGLHGTDAPQGLGHDVSHGCLRVANPVITRLAHEIPLGTPLDIDR